MTYYVVEAADFDGHTIYGIYKDKKQAETVLEKAKRDDNFYSKHKFRIRPISLNKYYGVRGWRGEA